MTELMKLARAQWDRAAAVGLTIAGMISLILGWIGVSGANAVVKQMPYIVSNGIGGLAMIAVGAALWVASDMRDEWSELRRLRLTLERLESDRVVLAPVDSLLYEETGARHGRGLDARNAMSAATRTSRETSSQVR